MITKKRRLWPFAFGLLVLAVLLTGCGGASTRVALTGASWPGITVFDGILYVAYGSQVYAIDPEQPDSMLWSFPASPNSRQNFFAPPAVDKDLVVVADYTNKLFAVDPATGQEKWSFESNRSRFIGGAAMDDSRVYVGSVDGILHALDRKDGTEVWAFATGRDIWSTPVLADGILYVTSLDRHVYAVEADSGNLLWRFPEIDGEEGGSHTIGAIVGTPSLYEGVLYFGSLENQLYALDIKTRDVLWTYQTKNWVWSSPILDEESGLLIGGDLDGHVFALDPENGKARWTFDTAGPVVGEPVIDKRADGTRAVYVCSGDSYLYRLNPEDGMEVAAPTLIKAQFTTQFLFIKTDTPQRPIPIYASPILFKDLVIIGAHQGDFLLYALDRETLLERWAFSPENVERSSSGEGDEEGSSLPPWATTLNLVLPIVIALLLVSLLNRGRRVER